MSWSQTFIADEQPFVFWVTISFTIISLVGTISNHVPFYYRLFHFIKMVCLFVIDQWHMAILTQPVKVIKPMDPINYIILRVYKI